MFYAEDIVKKRHIFSWCCIIGKMADLIIPLHACHWVLKRFGMCRDRTTPTIGYVFVMVSKIKLENSPVSQSKYMVLTENKNYLI